MRYLACLVSSVLFVFVLAVANDPGQKISSTVGEGLVEKFSVLTPSVLIGREATKDEIGEVIMNAHASLEDSAFDGFAKELATPISYKDLYKLYSKYQKDADRDEHVFYYKKSPSCRDLPYRLVEKAKNGFHVHMWVAGEDPDYTCFQDFFEWLFDEQRVPMIIKYGS